MLCRNKESLKKQEFIIEENVDEIHIMEAKKTNFNEFRYGGN